MNPQIAVIGAGSFGTAMAGLLGANGRDVRLWMRDAAHAIECQRTRINHRYQPTLKLSESVTVSSDLTDVVEGAEVLLFAVPSKAFRSVARAASQIAGPEVLLVSGTKGIEPGTSNLMSHVLADEFGAEARIGVLSGPNLAREIAEGQITGSVIASADAELCARVQKLFGCGNFRVYSNDDMIGVELAGLLKNIYAILAGIAAGSGAGGNTFGMLVTRSLAEMSRYAVAQGADPQTFLGLSGVGDLITTCTSPLSRNYKIGLELARGYSLDQAVGNVGQTAEGINTVEVVVSHARELGVSMPLAEGLYRVLFENRDLQTMVAELMQRDQRPETE